MSELESFELIWNEKKMYYIHIWVWDSQEISTIRKWCDGNSTCVSGLYVPGRSQVPKFRVESYQEETCLLLVNSAENQSVFVEFLQERKRTGGRKNKPQNYKLVNTITNIHSLQKVHTKQMDGYNIIQLLY